MELLEKFSYALIWGFSWTTIPLFLLLNTVEDKFQLILKKQIKYSVFLLILAALVFDAYLISLFYVMRQPLFVNGEEVIGQSIFEQMVLPQQVGGLWWHITELNIVFFTYIFLLGICPLFLVVPKLRNKSWVLMTMAIGCFIGYYAFQIYVLLKPLEVSAYGSMPFSYDLNLDERFWYWSYNFLIYFGMSLLMFVLSSWYKKFKLRQLNN